MPTKVAEKVSEEVLNFEKRAKEGKTAALKSQEVYTPKKVESVKSESLEAVGLPPCYIRLYEHKNYVGGRTRLINIQNYAPNACHSLHAMNFKDCLSSLEWNLPAGYIVEFREHHNCSGRMYSISGIGKDADVHDDGFGDKASSFRWYRV